jgi:predicted PurR-regulated permease PerM
MNKMMKQVLVLIMALLPIMGYANNDSIAIVELQKQVNKQERIIGNLRGELRSAKSVQKELSTNIDSLQKKMENTQNDLSSLSEKMNFDITNTQKQITDNANSLGDNIKSKTIWGISVAVFIVGLLVAVYLIINKRMQKGKSAIDKIKDAQKLIQEESLKLDDKLVNLLNQQLNVKANSVNGVSNNNQIDHSLALKVADEIVRIEMNLSRMDASIKGHKQLSKAVERIKNNFLANGYEMVDMLGKSYNDGMKVVANFVSDENLKDGEQIITGIIKPQVNYNGKMIQAAQITVSQNI